MLSSSARFVVSRLNFSTLSMQRFISSETAVKSTGVWCSISGFSPFVHRSDLQVVLSDFQPIGIDPLLDRNLYPNGRYLLQFKSAEEVHNLKKHVNEKYVKKYFVTTEDLVKQVKASTHGLSNKTVRIAGIPENIGFTKLQLAYFLEDYLVEKTTSTTVNSSSDVDTFRLEDSLNIRLVPHVPAGRVQYFVDLENEQEAERLVSEKGSAMIDGSEISMFHYQT